jgi:urea transport system permease protein
MLAEYWLFVLGGLFVLVTLFLPKGVVGTFLARDQKKPAEKPIEDVVAPGAVGQAAE